VTGDPAVIERIFADDFLGVSPEGVQYTKRGLVDDTKANPLGFTSNQINAMKIRFFGNLAVAQGDETFTSRSGEQGRFAWTDVLRRGGAASGGSSQPRTWSHPWPDNRPARRSSRAPISLRMPGERSPGPEVRTSQPGRGEAPLRLRISTPTMPLCFTPTNRLCQAGAPLSTSSKVFFGDFPRNEFELTSAEVVVKGQWAFDRGLTAA
jgi:Domain of unknown function (DUF4440)